MFDKHFHSHDRRTIVQQPSKIEVTERRAPTDESVRLLSEMEKAAEARLLGAVRVETNTVNGLVVFKQASFMADEVRYFVIVNINGREYRAEYPLERSEVMRLTRDRQALAEDLLLKAIGNGLSNLIVQELKKEGGYNG
jgi:hypothetical protein